MNVLITIHRRLVVVASNRKITITSLQTCDAELKHNFASLSVSSAWWFLTANGRKSYPRCFDASSCC